MSGLSLIPSAAGQPRERIVWAQVSSNLPAPSSFSDSLYVVMPQWHPDYYFEISDWPACHGSVLPAQGAECLVLLDSSRSWRCVWWASASTEFVPSEDAGGDASGSLSDLTVDTVLGGQTPITTVTALGGVLSGTLPDPGFAGAAHVALVTGTLTWPASAAYSNTATLTLNGASGTVYGVFTPTSAVLNPGFFDSANIGASLTGGGKITVQARTLGDGAPGASATMTYAGMIWD